MGGGGQRAKEISRVSTNIQLWGKIVLRLVFSFYLFACNSTSLRHIHSIKKEKLKAPMRNQPPAENARIHALKDSICP